MLKFLLRAQKDDCFHELAAHRFDNNREIEELACTKEKRKSLDIK